MLDSEPTVRVNGIQITPEQIHEEVQYHQADSLPEARFEATKALVVREILLQRAVGMGLVGKEAANKDIDGCIDKLLEQDIDVPTVDDETAQRYYDQNKKRFYTSPLFDVAHILFLAPADDEQAQEAARTRAEEVITLIGHKPDSFATLAKEYSACSSAKDGGYIGQISRGQTLPAFEAALMEMQAGDITTQPVVTEVGLHIIQVRERVDGQQLPFSAVSDWIKNYLHQKSWDKAFEQYLKQLVAQTHLEGFDLPQADSPLMQ